MAKKIKLGDVIAISTARGKAYAQYCFHHRYLDASRAGGSYGALIRILPGIFPEQPINLDSLVEAEHLYSIFFPLQAAVNRGIVTVVGNYRIPPFAQPLPLFRHGFGHPKTNKVAEWSVWDGDKLTKVGALTPQIKKLPLLSIWNDTLLRERIESGWLPEHSEHG
jgi:hypothetical protein